MNKEYIDEIKQRWGETEEYKEYLEKTKQYSKDKHNDIIEGLNIILAEFSTCMLNDIKPISVEAQTLVEKLKNYITSNFYSCTNDILFGLGQMYVLDERFKCNIDKHGAGTAEFIKEAITIYCNK